MNILQLLARREDPSNKDSGLNAVTPTLVGESFSTLPDI